MGEGEGGALDTTGGSAYTVSYSHNYGSSASIISSRVEGGVPVASTGTYRDLTVAASKLAAAVHLSASAPYSSSVRGTGHHAAPSSSPPLVPGTSNLRRDASGGHGVAAATGQRGDMRIYAPQQPQQPHASASLLLPVTRGNGLSAPPAGGISISQQQQQQQQQPSYRFEAIDALLARLRAAVGEGAS